MLGLYDVGGTVTQRARLTDAFAILSLVGLVLASGPVALALPHERQTMPEQTTGGRTMAEPIRNWEQWEINERRAFYKRKIAANGGELPERLSAWTRECDEHIERERARLLAEQAQEAGQ